MAIKSLTKTRAAELVKILNTNPATAERHLCLIGDQGGDKAIAKVLTETPAIALAGLFDHHDGTHETVAASLLTAKKIIDLLAVEPARWDGSNEYFFADKAMHILIALLVNRPEDERVEIVRKIFETARTRLFLLFALTGLEVPEALSDVYDNTPSQLWWWIHESDPELAQEILDAIVGLRVKKTFNQLKEDATDRIRGRAEKKTKTSTRVMFDPA